MPTDPPLHPALEPIAWLLGTWTGEGRGDYPTIEPFTYEEESRYWHSGKPLIAYFQRTWSPGLGEAMHSESGFLRIKEGGALELVIAHGFGIVEVSEGMLAGARLELSSRDLVSSSTANQVEGLRRVVEVDGDTLSYEIEMAAAGQPLGPHLTATLKRTS